MDYVVKEVRNNTRKKRKKKKKKCYFIKEELRIYIPFVSYE